jgi:hypothetical protein
MVVEIMVDFEVVTAQFGVVGKMRRERETLAAPQLRAVLRLNDLYFGLLQVLILRPAAGKEGEDECGE